MHLRHLGSVAALIAAGAVLLLPATGQAGGPPALSWSPSTGDSFDYGAFIPGQTSSLTFTLLNSGGRATSALTVSLSGSSTFTITADACSATSLGPRKSCSVTVLYTPTTEGQAETATLSASGKKPGATASVTLDAAGPKAAVVTITKIALEQSDGSEVTLSDQAVTTNLLTLSNATSALLNGAVIQAGTYTELRFEISGGYVASSGGSIYASSPTYAGLPAGATVAGQLQVPQSLDVTPSGGSITTAADSKLLLADFDIAQMLGGMTAASTWTMGSAVTGADLTLSGNVIATVKLGAGVTLPVLNGTQVTLADFSATLTNPGGSSKTVALTPIAAGSSTYGASFKYLFPGSYTLSLQAPAGMSFTTSPATPSPITVSSGQDTEADYTITSASAP